MDRDQCVSIIVPVYNSEQYLERCIESIIHQSYPYLDILLIDDGSSDSSFQICKEYEAIDARIRVFSQKNQGASSARNFGVEQAKGKVISFVDSDDCIHQNAIDYMMQLYDDTHKQMVVCELLEGNELSQDFLKSSLNSKSECINVNEENVCAMYDNPYICWIPCGRLIPKELLEKYPFEVNRVYEDNAIVPKWITELDSVVYSPEKIYFYQKNPLGVSKNVMPKSVEDSIWAYNQQMEHFQMLGWKKCYQKALHMYLKNFVWKYNEIVNKNPENAQVLKQKAKLAWKQHKKEIHLEFKEKRYLYPLFGLSIWF